MTAFSIAHEDIQSLVVQYIKLEPFNFNKGHDK